MEPIYQNATNPNPIGPTLGSWIRENKYTTLTTIIVLSLATFIIRIKRFREFEMARVISHLVIPYRKALTTIVTEQRSPPTSWQQIPRHNSSHDISVQRRNPSGRTSAFIHDLTSEKTQSRSYLLPRNLACLRFHADDCYRSRESRSHHASIELTNLLGTGNTSDPLSTQLTQTSGSPPFCRTPYRSNIAHYHRGFGMEESSLTFQSGICAFALAYTCPLDRRRHAHFLLHSRPIRFLG